MYLGYSILFLALVVGHQCQEFCNFDSNLCNWSNIHPCKFKHITNTPLDGETGYLMLSKDTCKKAGIAFTDIEFKHAFQMRYFINGTGDAYLTVIADYVMAGPRHVWKCRTEKGPQWNNVEILVKDGIFDQLKSIIIEAVVNGNATIAIGDIGYIEASINNRRETSCPTSRASTEPERLKTEESISDILKVGEPRKNHSIDEHVRNRTAFNPTHIQANRSKTGKTHEVSDTAIEFPTDPPVLSVTPKAKRKQDITNPKAEKRNIPSGFYGRSTPQQGNKNEPIVKHFRTFFPNQVTVDVMPRYLENGSKNKTSLTGTNPIPMNRSKVTGTTTEFPTESPSLSITTQANQKHDRTKFKPEERNVTYVPNGQRAPKQINNIKEPIIKPPITSHLNDTAVDVLPHDLENDSQDPLTIPGSQLKWSVVIGGSLFAIMLLVLMFTFSIIMYKRKIDILNVYEVDGKSLVNNMHY